MTPPQTTAHSKPFLSEELRLTAPIPRLFRRYAIPGVVGLLFVGLQTVVDGIILGNYAGAAALAGVNLFLPFYSFIIALAVVLGVGCQAMVSVRLGRMDRQGADDALTSGFLALTGISTLASILLLTVAPQIVGFMGVDDALREQTLGYMYSLLPFFPFITVMFFCDYQLKAMGRTLLSVGIISLVVLLNIGLDLLFIVVLKQGTWGAGLATGISFTAGMLLALPGIVGRRNMVSVLRGRWRANLVGKMMYNGSSEGFSEISSGITALLFNMAIMRYLGPAGVAALAAVNYILFIGVTIFLGISDGIIPIIAYNHGAGQKARIRKIVGLAIKVNAIIGLAVCLLLSLSGERIVSLFFRNGDQAVSYIAAGGLACYAFAFLLNGFNILASSYFTAIENARTSIIVSLMRSLLFSSAGILLLPVIFGPESIWFAVPAAELLTFLFALLLIKRSPDFAQANIGKTFTEGESSEPNTATSRQET